MSNPLNDEVPAERGQPLQTNRRRVWQWLLAAVAAFAFVQSVTFTPSIDSVAVDAVTRQPLAGLVIAAVWETERISVGGGGPADVLKTVEVVTAEDGSFHLAPALLAHAPVLPFSWTVRSWRYMPLLLACRNGYYGEQAWSNDGSLAGLFSLRRTSLSTKPFDMKPLPAGGQTVDIVDIRSTIEVTQTEMIIAESSCKDGVLCQSTDLSRSLASCKDALQSM